MMLLDKYTIINIYSVLLVLPEQDEYEPQTAE